MKLTLLTVGLLMLGTASHARCLGTFCPPEPRPQITIQNWGNGMSTVRDNQGGRATIQEWNGGMTTIRGNDGSHVTCQTWPSGMVTCR